MQQGNRLSNIEDQSFIASELSVPSSESGSEEEIDFEKHLDIEAKRHRTENEKGSENSEVSLLSKFKLDFSNALIEVEKIDRSSKLSAIEAIPKYPEIVQNVAYTVSALPPTQVSVERLFSALRIIHSDLCAVMGFSLHPKIDHYDL